MRLILVQIVLLLLQLVSCDEVKRVYHIQGIAAVFEELQEEFPSEMDIWHQETILLQDGALELRDFTLYATPSFAAKVESRIKSASTLFKIAQQPIDVEAAVLKEKADILECRRRTSALAKSSLLTEDSFFDCFRTDEEIFTFLDDMVKQHSSVISKFSISKTFEGRTIPAFKISSGSLATGASKPAIFIQGMLHAREWLGPPTVLYSMASIVEGLSANEASVVSMMSKFDFYYVPLVNIDGYRYTWAKKRMWRKNRRVSKRNIRGWFDPAEGVDLNRNYGPEKTFCKAGASKNPKSDTYCGSSPFSEPEIAGIEDFLVAHPEIAGAIDVHCYGDLVLRPYGLSHNPIDEPHNSKMKSLGDHMTDEINQFHPNNRGKYRSIPASKLYVASGTFLDSIYESHNQIPSITLELRGGNFVVDPKLIRVSGPEIFHGIQVFADEVDAY